MDIVDDDKDKGQGGGKMRRTRMVVREELHRRENPTLPDAFKAGKGSLQHRQCQQGMMTRDDNKGQGRMGDNDAEQR